MCIRDSCTKPPWGKLVAVDLGSGDIVWDQPLGTIKDLAPKIVPNFNLKRGIPLIFGKKDPFLKNGSGSNVGEKP